MANFKVNSVPSWIQYVATASQTEFSIPFPFIDNSDLSVWQNGVLLTLSVDYTLSGAQTASGGQLTLNVGASLNDQIVIQDLMVIDRTSIYVPTISNLTGSQLNNDFNRDVIMIRDTTTTVDYLMLQYYPYANISQDIDVTVDRRLPILPPLSTWQKNAGNTAIIAVSLPSSVVGVDGSFTNNNRITTTNTVPGDNYIQQSDIQIVGDTITAISGNMILTGANNVSLVTSGNVVFSPGGNLILDGVTWPTTSGLTGQSPYLINSTLLGWQYNAGSTIIQNNSFIYADDTGTANAYAIALIPAVTGYVEGQTFYFKAAHSNTGNSTLNVNGLGAKSLLKNFNAQVANADILAGQIVQVTYDGTSFQLDSPVANMTDGGGVNPGTINELAYYASSGNVVSGLSTAAGILTFLTTPTSANLLAAMTTKTGTGLSVFNDGPTLIAPALGTPASGNLSNTSNYPLASNVQVFTSGGTYTPTARMVYADITVVGGGGGGGGCAFNFSAAGSGGGGGGTARGIYTAAQIGASATITVGAAGTAGSSSGGNGGAGGTSSAALSGVGTLTITANGGSGGLGDTGTGAGGTTTLAGSAGGTAAVGNIFNVTGGTGGGTWATDATITQAISGYGGSSLFGTGGPQLMAKANQTTTALAGTGYGAGGSGCAVGDGGSAGTGAAGTAGIIYVIEYLN